MAARVAAQARPGPLDRIPYPVEVEIWPTSIALPAGYRLSLVVQGKDFERPGVEGEQKGSGWFLHDDPTDRPRDRFGGANAVHTGGATDSYLLLPVIAGAGKRSLGQFASDLIAKFTAPGARR
jgi:predicted acyl esterase